MSDKAENARQRIAEAAANMSEEENRQEQDSGEYPATERAEKIKDTAGD